MAFSDRQLVVRNWFSLKNIHHHQKLNHCGFLRLETGGTVAVTVFFSLVSSLYNVQFPCSRDRFPAAVMGSRQLAWDPRSWHAWFPDSWHGFPAAGMHVFPTAGMGSLQLAWVPCSWHGFLQLAWVPDSWHGFPAAGMGFWQLA